MNASISITVVAASSAEELGYRGQQVLADAAVGIDYRIIGGHMVRLLLHAYPSVRATPRTTVDADAGVGSVEIVGELMDNLVKRGFTKTRGNSLQKVLGPEAKLEVDVLTASEKPRSGIFAMNVPGVGQVDALPEMTLAMNAAPVIIAVEAHLLDASVLSYTVKVPPLDVAVILKAASWAQRRSFKDLADLATLFEVREQHPDALWKLNAETLIGRRRDAAVHLHRLAGTLARHRQTMALPAGLEALRLAALIRKHVTAPRP